MMDGETGRQRLILDMIKQDLSQMIAEARSKNQWIYCHFVNNLWFSPDEFEQENANGNFLWSRFDWGLGDPKEHLAGLRMEANKARDRADIFAKRIGK